MSRKKAPADSKYPGLNKREALIFEYICDFYAKNNFPPTVREISQGLHIPSTSTVYYYLESLEKIGYIRKNGGKMRAIEILKGFEDDKPTLDTVTAPVIGEIAAGSPILATENIVDYFPVDLNTFHPVNDVFILKVKGDSMINAGILNGDYVIVEKRDYGENGDIVAAIIENEATVKRYFKEKDYIRLQPENNSYAPIIVKDVHIAGKVIGLYRHIL